MSEAVERLVLAVLLSAIKKRAQAIHLKAGKDRFVIDFTVDELRVEEMRPPIELVEPVFAQLAAMTFDGVIQLEIGEARRAFSCAIITEGALRRCELRPL